MKIKIIIVFPALILMACASTQPTAVDVQDTLNSVIQTNVVQTQTAFPTLTPFPSTFTPTVTIVNPTPSLISIPTSIVLITPNPVQLERWKEYQIELAKVVLAQHAEQVVPFPELALCEWDILGQSEQKVYLWVECVGDDWARGPAVIHFEADGSIRNVEYAFPGYGRDIVIQSLFPEDVQAQITFYFSSERSQQMTSHLEYRLTHPEEPPSIVLLGTPRP